MIHHWVKTKVNGENFRKVLWVFVIIDDAYLWLTRRVGMRALFFRYLSLFWPVRQFGAAVEPNLSLSQNTPISWYTYLCIAIYISWCVNRVIVFKFLVCSVNNTHRTLLYVISLCLYGMYCENIFSFCFQIQLRNYAVKLSTVV